MEAERKREIELEEEEEKRRELELAEEEQREEEERLRELALTEKKRKEEREKKRESERKRREIKEKQISPKEIPRQSSRLSKNDSDEEEEEIENKSQRSSVRSLRSSHVNTPRGRRSSSVRKTELVVKSPRVSRNVPALKVIMEKDTRPLPQVKAKVEYTGEDSTPYMPIIPSKPQLVAQPRDHDAAALEELRREEEIIDMVEEIKRLHTQYPEMGIKIPKHDESYHLIKERRNMYTKKVAIKQKVKDYQIYILVGAGILELLGTFVLQVDVDEFTVEQYKLLNKYEQDLEAYAKNNYGGVLDGYASEYKIIFTMFGYYFMMIIVKFILSKLPMAGMKDSISETIMYLMRGNDIGNRAAGPVNEASPAAKLVGDLAGYFPMLKMFMSGNKDSKPMAEKSVQIPTFDD